MYGGNIYHNGELIGVVKSQSGVTDKKFVEAVKKLMEEHKVEYLWLCWGRFAPESKSKD